MATDALCSQASRPIATSSARASRHFSARSPARDGPRGRAHLLCVKDGESVANVTVRLPPGASIAGHVTDERGEPAAEHPRRTPAAALSGRRTRCWHRSATRRRPTSGDVPHSRPAARRVSRRGDATGGVPGRALTNADVDAALKGGRVAPTPPADTSVTYAPVFFPGTTREANAAPVVLAVGEERQNVDLRLELVRTASVEGRVTTSDGQPSANLTVTLGSAPAASPLPSMRAARTGRTGASGSRAWRRAPTP